MACTYRVWSRRLISNIPLETTAYTLAATLGLLALNQDSQDEVFQQIEEVIGHDRDPVKITLLTRRFFIDLHLFC